MAQACSTASPNLGFLTVVHEANGYLGGYLVTNGWGRPLEFRLSTAVQPNRIQQILYGGTLRPYICADLIGKALVEKTALTVQLIVTDSEPVLDLRLRVEAPVVWIASPDDPVAAALAVKGLRVPLGEESRELLLCHPCHGDDAFRIRDMLERLDGCLDLTEPFARIREAMSEARKMGVTSRA